MQTEKKDSVVIDTEVQTKKEEVQTKKEEVQMKREDVQMKREDVQMKREDVQMKREGSKVADMEVQTNEVKVQTGEEKIKVASERNKAMFNAFEKAGGFDKVFSEHISEWKQKAEEKIRKENPWIDEKSDEWKTKTQLTIFLDNRPAIEQKAQEKGIDLKSIYGALENSADTLRVSRSFTKDCTLAPSIPEQAKATFSKEEQSNISRRGDTLESTSADGTRKVMNLKTGEVSIESESGIRIPSKQEYQSSFEIDARIQMLSGELADINGTLSKQQDYLSNISNRFGLGKIEKVTKESFDTLRQKFQKDSTDPDMNPTDQKVAKDMLEKINTMETEFNKNQERKEALLINLTALKESKTTHTTRYQESLRSETEASRDNLKYLSSIGLDSLGQSGVDAIVDFIKEKRKGQSGAGEITLQKSFSNTEKKDFSQVVRDIIGTDPFIKDSIPPTLQPAITPQNIRGLMMRSGVLSQTGEFNKIRFMEKIQRKQPTEKTP